MISVSRARGAPRSARQRRSCLRGVAVCLVAAVALLGLAASATAAARWQARRQEPLLPVILVCFNPAGFASRWSSVLAQQARLAATRGVLPLTVELAYGDAPFRVTSPADKRHLQLRVPAEDAGLWVKEALINAGVARLLPPDWRAVAFADAEVVWDRPTWAVETLHALLSGGADVLQPYSRAVQFDVEYEALASVLARGGHFKSKRLGDAFDLSCSWGLAWALSRRAWDRLGGLYPFAVAGSGDVLLAEAIFHNATINRGLFPPDAAAPAGAAQWYAAASQPPWLRAGYVEGRLFHEDHGLESDRNYFLRQTIISGLDPAVHLRLNADGVPVPTALMPRKMLRSLLEYLTARKEDGHA